jgi:transcriptional regulator with XRE-family HTH domain
MNRNERDWPAVRAAADARMKELGLSTAELARRSKMSQSTIRALLAGRTRPHGITVHGLAEGLGWPWGYLWAIAEGQQPESPPAVTMEARASDEGKRARTLLSLTDVGQGAQMAADYRAYVSLVARELSEGMTGRQRSAASRFLSDLSNDVLCH